MNEEFYASIKLVSGEEIFSKVCAFEENDKVLLVLDHPIFVETVFVPKLGIPIAKVNPWLSLTQDTTFIIERNKVITMTEIKDVVMIKMHNRYVREQNKSTNQTQISPNMGYVSSIAEARVSLEKLYKSSTTSNTNLN
jgi:hypothetical protein